MGGEDAADIEEQTNHIWDIPYVTLHQILAGDLEGHSLEDVAKYVRTRNSKLAHCIEPFGTPSKASRTKVESGKLTLDSGLTVQVPTESHEVVWAISNLLDLDEVDAFILWKSFLRNCGLPDNTRSDEEVPEQFITFYFEERLAMLRCIIPLLRASSDTAATIHDLAKEIFFKIVPKPREFALALSKQYLRRTKQPLPEKVMRDPRTAANYAKQSVREQVVLLEVLFWALSDCSLHDGSLTDEIYKIGYATDLGTLQQNSSLLLDEEGTRLVNDMESLWRIILIELLQVDQLLIRDCAETTTDSTLLVSFPEYLTRTQDLIFSYITPRHGCILLAWACVLAHLSDLDVTERTAFAPIVLTAAERFRQLSAYILQPEFKLFQHIESTLLTSPLFVTPVALSTASAITYPNSPDYRFVYKTLVMGLCQLVQIEFIPDFDGLVNIWIALFGTGEESVAARICRDYWDYDWKMIPARRGIFDVARSRFPIHFTPLLRLLKATAGTGSLDTVSTTLSSEDRKVCGAYVYHYLLRLPTFAQIIPASARSGVGALYEAVIDAELYTGGVMYRNLRSIRLPGGSILLRNTSSRLLSTVTDPNDPVVVEWEHVHSGWKLILEVLRNYLSGNEISRGSAQPRPWTASQRHPEFTLTLEDVGIEGGDNEQTVTHALDLVRAIIHGNPGLMTQLMEGLESDDSSIISPPDLVEVTTRVLEGALSRSAQTKFSPPPRLITSAIGVLTALLSSPVYAYRVWPFLRSTSSLFGTINHTGSTAALLASERIAGNYEMTLSLISLVRALFDQAISSLLIPDPVMQPLKEIVLLRAVTFIHSELWIEHSAWKYAKLADRFDIGRQITSLYGDILLNSPPAAGKDGAFSGVVSFIMESFLFRANTATINPLIYAITSGDELLEILARARRLTDSAKLIRLLESHTRLSRLVLDQKRSSTFAAKLSLLEQVLCVGVVGGAASLDTRRSKSNPVDVVAGYVQYRVAGSNLALESIKLLSALCRSLSLSHVSPPSIIAHLSDAEATAATFVRILRHPWDDLRLRNAIWQFVALTVDVQPALANLFVRGEFYAAEDIGKTEKGKDKEEKEKKEKEKVKNGKSNGDEKSMPESAMKVACGALGVWDSLWDTNPHLLTSILAFLEVVWRHALEHKAILEPRRTDQPFWEAISGIGGKEVGPAPEWKTQSVVDFEGQTHSDCHSSVSLYSYRTRAKAHAIQILALDVEFSLSTRKASDAKASTPLSFQMVRRYFTTQEELNDHISEATANYYDPDCHKQLASEIQHAFPTLATLQGAENTEEREFGDDYVFPTALVRERVQLSAEEDAEAIRHKIFTVNLNLSLADSEVALTRSWKRLLQTSCPLLRADNLIREYILAVAESVSGDIATESRSGLAMITVHSERLSVLLALMEISWFLPPEKLSKSKHVELFVALMSHIRDIMANEYFPPAAAIRSDRTTRFYRPIIQMIYFCAHKARLLGSEPKTYNADQRLTINGALTEAIGFIIEALRDVFDLAKSGADVEIDKNMDLLTATFEQCTRPELPLSPTIWLSRCQEFDLIRASLELLIRTDLTGLRDPSLLLVRRYPLYARHILFFHLSLARLPSSAERLANDGVVAAYANVNIRAALSAGLVEPSTPELPGERNPTHRAWCNMLAVITSVTGAVGPNSHFVDEEVLGIVHLYGAQITHSLTWRIGESLTIPFLEELGLVVALFQAIACCSTARNSVAQSTLWTYAERASELLQDLNYALTHPNHLVSLLDAVTNDERTQVEKDVKNLAVESSTQLIDPAKRPLLAALVQKLLFVTRDLVSSLEIISNADIVLTSDASEWPSADALVPPITKIAPGEAASTGTLIELGSCAVDMLKYLADDPAMAKTTAATLPSSIALPSFSPRQTIFAASQLLETVLTYAVTQLAICLEGPDNRESPRMEMDEVGYDRIANENRRRTSIGVNGRVRRDELVVDLKALLTRSRPVVEKARQQLKMESRGMVSLLVGFLEKRELVDD
ncbi:nucleoporin subcomplex protein binding to Pom34-domain-containing protein [Hysterangium stoloniferum]|nr:nucleoporin subcomplex protein binding to Pom34-domain-containing protein [Hysterangium stoloniferum]